MPLKRKRYKYVHRYREIANILLKHGFGFVLGHAGLNQFINIYNKILSWKEKKQEARLSLPERMRLALEELGPTFVKLGQVLSTRPDLMPEEYITQLEKLQDRVPPFPYPEVREQIEAELGGSVEEIFKEFYPEPLAAASIGQVHIAYLKTGEKVVVKVQRPGIVPVIEADLEILHNLASFADKHSPWGELYSFSDMTTEFEYTIREEINYITEARHTDAFRDNLKKEPDVYVPKVYWELTTQRVMVMEYVDGIKLNDIEALDKSGVDRSKIARRLSKIVLKQILLDGYYHADPHPGNIAVRPNNVIVFMDFGLMGVLSERTRVEIIMLVLGLIDKDSEKIIRALNNLGVIPSSIDKQLMRREVDRLRNKYYYMPVSDIKLADSAREILSLAQKYHVTLPMEFTMLAKCLVTTEGVTGMLDPDLNLVQVAEPLGKRLVTEQINLKTVGRSLHNFVEITGMFLNRTPRHLINVLEKVSKDNLRIKFENINADSNIKRANNIANRISISLVIAALIIGSSVLSGHQGTLFWGLPVAEIGFLSSGLMGLWLIIAILRSGRL